MLSTGFLDVVASGPASCRFIRLCKLTGLRLFRGATALGNTAHRMAQLGLAGAAIVLSACAAPDLLSGPTPNRQSSMMVMDVTCPTEFSLAPRFEQPIDPIQPNQKLMAEALHHVVNRERCQKGAAPLGLSIEAVLAAAEHARTMAEHDFIGHHSPVTGRETLERRLTAVSLGYSWAAENLARAPAFVLARSGDGCLATSEGGGRALSYGDVAETLMAMWMASSKHRLNVLNRRYRSLGAGIGINPLKHRCGEIAAAMAFVG